MEVRLLGLRIGTTSPLAAQRSILLHQALLQRNLTRLATGLRLNTAADDPAGLAISERLRSTISGANAMLSNATRAVNLVRTAEGALTEINTQLVEIRNLAVQAGNSAVLGDTGAQIIQQQIENAIGSINRIAETTQFAGKPLLNGTFENEQFAIAEGSPAGLTIPSVAANALGRDIGEPGGFQSLADIDVTTPEGAAGAASVAAALEVVGAAINDVSNIRGELGAFQANTLETATRSLSINRANLLSAESGIRDIDLSAAVGETILARIRFEAGLMAQSLAGNRTGLLVDLLA